MSHPLARVIVGADDAPTLMLLHGITASAVSQTDAIDHWAALGYRVVAVDARGHGLSPRWTPQELERAGEVLVDDAVAVLEDLLVQARGRRALDLVAAPPPVVVGHSMGAATAMVVGGRRPELVSGVVLLDPARYGSRGPAELLARGAARERARAAELADPAAAVARALDDVEIPDSEAVAGVWASQRMDPALLRTGVVAPRVRRSGRHTARRAESMIGRDSRTLRSKAQSMAVRSGVVTLRPLTTATSSGIGAMSERVSPTTAAGRPSTLRAGKRYGRRETLAGVASRMPGSCLSEASPRTTAAASWVRAMADGTARRAAAHRARVSCRRAFHGGAPRGGWGR